MDIIYSFNGRCRDFYLKEFLGCCLEYLDNFYAGVYSCLSPNNVFILNFRLENRFHNLYRKIRDKKNRGLVYAIVIQFNSICVYLLTKAKTNKQTQQSNVDRRCVIFRFKIVV